MSIGAQGRLEVGQTVRSEAGLTLASRYSPDEAFGVSGHCSRTTRYPVTLGEEGSGMPQTIAMLTSAGAHPGSTSIVPLASAALCGLFWGSQDAAVGDAHVLTEWWE